MVKVRRGGYRQGEVVKVRGGGEGEGRWWRRGEVVEAGGGGGEGRW